MQATKSRDNAMKRIGLQRLESFVRKTLPRRLAKDLLHFRMVKEADLECCVYYHLRRFLGRDDGWRFLLESTRSTPDTSSTF